MAAAKKKDVAAEAAAEKAEPVTEAVRPAPVVSIGDRVAVVRFGDVEHELTVDQVHSLRRQLDKAFVELS